MSNNEEFKNHLVSKLEAINSDYTYNVNWYIDIEKKKVTDSNFKVNVANKEIFIVLTPMPSRSYGDSCIEQQLEITAYCDLNSLSDAMDILSEYQNTSVNKKWWTDDGTLVNESWYSPSVQDMSVNFKVHKGSIISMTGRVMFTDDVVDVEKVYLCGQWNKIFEFVESTVADSVPNLTTDSTRKRAKNRSLIYKIDLKCKNTSSIFCQLVRDWKESIISINTSVPVKLVYTDGHEKEVKMIINSAVLSSTDGTIPTLSVSLYELMS